MTPTAVALIVASAFFHAFWNFFSKRRRPALAFFALAALAAALVMLPVLWRHRPVLAALPPTIWLLVLATGLAQLVYFTGLAGAYRRGDISLAYPLSRALPVLMVAAISLARGGTLAPLGLAGMVLVTGGCLILPLPRFGDWQPRHYTDAVYLLALLAASGTTGYTLIDDEVLRRLRASLDIDNTTITLIFVGLQTSSTALLLLTASLLHRPERQALLEIARARGGLATALITGLVIMFTYGLVLAAMAYVRDVSYVAAFRQLSIPIGAVLGLTLQNEPAYRPKLAGIGVVTLGLILVGLG